MFKRSSKHFAIALVAIGGLAPGPAPAETAVAPTADAIRPLQPGDAAPSFVVTAVDGKAYTFDPAALERPVVLITFRGGWCPYCNMHLSELRHVMPGIREADVDILFLSGDRADLLYESLSAETQEAIDGLDYDIYSDADARAAIALGIAFRASETTITRRREKQEDIADSSMERHGVLPVPAVFAIGSDGIIRFVYTNADYKVRLPADQVLEVAKRMSADGPSTATDQGHD